MTPDHTTAIVLQRLHFLAWCDALAGAALTPDEEVTMLRRRERIARYQHWLWRWARVFCAVVPGDDDGRWN